MYRRKLIQSFKLAIEGIRFTLRSEMNMRIHLFMAVMAVLCSFILKISALEFIFVIFSIALVLITETANTAFELLLDFLHGDKFHPDVKILKDIAAGGVFIAAANAFIIGVVVFGPRLLGMASLFFVCKKGGI